MPSFRDYHQPEFAPDVWSACEFMETITPETELLVPQNRITVIDPELADMFCDDFGFEPGTTGAYRLPDDDDPNSHSIAVVALHNNVSAAGRANALRSHIIHQQVKALTYDPESHAFYSEVLGGYGEQLYLTALMRQYGMDPIGPAHPLHISLPGEGAIQGSPTSVALMSAAAVAFALKQIDFTDIDDLLWQSGAAPGYATQLVREGLSQVDPLLPVLIEDCPESNAGYSQAALMVLQATKELPPL